MKTKRAGKMDRRGVVLVLAGGAIGLISSLITMLVTYSLQGRRLSEQLEREDRLRKEEIERDRGLYLDAIERQNRLMTIDTLWGDIQIMQKQLNDLPREEVLRRRKLEEDLNKWARRREELMRVEGLLLMEP